MYRQYRDTKVHDYSFVKMGHGIMLICSYQEDNIPEDYQNMLHHINDILVEAGFLPESYHIGICDEILPLDRLNEAIIKSKNANHRRTVFRADGYSVFPDRNLQICYVACK